MASVVATGVAVSEEDDSVGCAVGLLVFTDSGVFLLVGVGAARGVDVAVAIFPLPVVVVATSVLLDCGVARGSPCTAVPIGVRTRVS